MFHRVVLCNILLWCRGLCCVVLCCGVVCCVLCVVLWCVVLCCGVLCCVVFHRSAVHVLVIDHDSHEA